jgi:RNA:NAD 2'-phosphotransferase (TPT1/KptA family)
VLQGRREDDRGQERLERTSEVAEKAASQGRFIWGKKEEKNCSKFLSYVERHEKGISGGLAGALQK